MPDDAEREVLQLLCDRAQSGITISLSALFESQTNAGLRNLLIHEKVEPYEYPCVPTEAIVLQLEKSRERFLHPQLAIPKFEGEVVTINTDDPGIFNFDLVHEYEVLQKEHGFNMCDFTRCNETATKHSFIKGARG